jgi:hypothetical protein
MGDVTGISDVLNVPNEPKRARSGYIYVLRFSEGVVKIGMTINDPTGRAKQWRLRLLAYVRCKDARCAERKVHKFLAKIDKVAMSCSKSAWPMRYRPGSAGGPTDHRSGSLSLTSIRGNAVDSDA